MKSGLFLGVIYRDTLQVASNNDIFTHKTFLLDIRLKKINMYFFISFSHLFENSSQFKHCGEGV